eukprot:SAG31_NODE_2831_length_5026_cov_4.017049_1_plen_110_part_00
MVLHGAWIAYWVLITVPHILNNIFLKKYNGGPPSAIGDRESGGPGISWRAPTLAKFSRHRNEFLKVTYFEVPVLNLVCRQVSDTVASMKYYYGTLIVILHVRLYNLDWY